MHRAVTVSAQTDLRPFLTLLKRYQIRHHVTEESGALVVWAADQTQAQMIAAAFAQWQSGELVIPASAGENPDDSSSRLLPVKSMLQGFVNALWLAPVTVILILACAVVALISGLGNDLSPIRSLFFPDVAVPGQFPLLALINGLDSVSDWLRTLTPALMHFGALHLVFNMLWLWFFGRIMEPVLGGLVYALVILVMAFSGNVLQYLWSGDINFGGMSGVVYGQIGLIWMWQSVRPQTQLRLPLPMIMMFLLALVLMEILASSMIASAAHLGGLLAGMLCGLLLGVLIKSDKVRS